MVRQRTVIRVTNRTVNFLLITLFLLIWELLCLILPFVLHQYRVFVKDNSYYAKLSRVPLTAFYGTAYHGKGQREVSVKKLINRPEAMVRESLEGLALAYPRLLKVHFEPTPP